MVKEFCVIFVQVREKSCRINYLFHILFSLCLFMVVREVVVLLAVSKCERYHFV